MAGATTGRVPARMTLGVGVGDGSIFSDSIAATTPAELLGALGCDLEAGALRVRDILLTLGASSGEIGEFLSDREGTRAVSALGRMEGCSLPFGAVPGARKGDGAARSGGGSIDDDPQWHTRFLRRAHLENASRGGANAGGTSGGDDPGSDLISLIESARIKVHWLFSNVAGDSPIDDDIFPQEGSK